MEWKSFPLNELFTISPGQRLETRNKTKGEIPFIGATDNNNGVTGFVGNKNASLDCNVLGVNYDGAPCVAHYHPYYCLFTDSVKRLHLRNYNDNPYVLLYFVVLTAKQKTKYNYGYKFNEQRMLRQKLQIPASNNQPDYNYMSEYVKAKKKKALDRYKAYIEKQLSQIKYKKVKPISEMEWKPFSIVSLFNMIRGREGNMAMLEDGTIPLVSAKNANNGVKGFVSARKIINGNCITLNNDGDGGAGLAYYQPSIMALDTHVTALIPKNDLNKWSLLFIANCLSQLHGFFGHGLSISNKRAERIKIMLPTNENGAPDFVYMEQYAKNMVLRKYQQYLAYLDKKQH